MTTVGHWTVKDYDRAHEAGIFGIDPKIELLFGGTYPTRDIGDNGWASMGAPHAAALQYLTRAAIRFFDAERVGSQTPSHEEARHPSWRQPAEHADLSGRLIERTRVSGCAGRSRVASATLTSYLGSSLGAD